MYRNLFRKKINRVGGDITPGYSLLGDEKVEEIAKEFPGSKILYILRNPIDRTWSQLNYNVNKGDIKLPKDIGLLKRIVIQDFVMNRNAYTKIIRRWRKYFGSDNMKIIFFEDIQTAPQETLVKIFEFLEVEGRNSAFVADAREKVNTTYKDAIPVELKRFLACNLFGELKELESEFGEKAGIWRKDAEDAIGMNLR